jgi:predicted nicotinamide N-methyase
VTPADADPASTLVEEVVLGDRRLLLERPADPEALLDESRFDCDEFLPYWAERWPSGDALAVHVSTLPLAGRSVLELGCGLGLPSLAAATRGARVLATDWAPEATTLLAENARRNGLAVETAVVDWREPGAFIARGRFDLVLAADIAYEERNVEPVVALLAELGAETLIADPGRRHMYQLLDRLVDDGWQLDTVAAPTLPAGGIHRARRLR